MNISPLQQKLRRWFRSRGWRTNVPTTGHGAWLWMPVQEMCGYHDVTTDAYYKQEVLPSIEIDRFGYEMLTIKLESRYVFTVPPKGGLTDKQKQMQLWKDSGWFNISFAELKKLVELAEATQRDYIEFKQQIEGRKRHASD